MNLFFSMLNSAFDLMFWPFRSLPPIWPLLFFSLVTALLMLLVFRHFSNQTAIRRTKDRLSAHLLEVRLFQDQLSVVLRAYGRLLRATGAYLLLSLKPLAVMIVPLVLLMAQIELRMGRNAAAPANAILVKAQLADQAALDSAELRVSDGVEITAPPLRIPEHREIDWRIAATRAGDFHLEVKAAGQVVTKEFSAGDSLPRISPLRTASFLDLLLYPGEPKLDGKGVRSIEVQYPTREIWFFGFHVHWLIPFFMLSLVLGFALKGVMGAEF
jgi:hypothetical protein